MDSEVDDDDSGEEEEDDAPHNSVSLEDDVPPISISLQASIIVDNGGILQSEPDSTFGKRIPSSPLEQKILASALPTSALDIETKQIDVIPYIESYPSSVLIDNTGNSPDSIGSEIVLGAPQILDTMALSPSKTEFATISNISNNIINSDSNTGDISDNKMNAAGASVATPSIPVSNSGFKSNVSMDSNGFGASSSFNATAFGTNSSGFISTTSSGFGIMNSIGATGFGANNTSFGFGNSNSLPFGSSVSSSGVNGFDGSSRDFGVVSQNSATSSGDSPVTTLAKAAAELELEEDEDGKAGKADVRKKVKQIPPTPRSIKVSNDSKKQLRKEIIVKQGTVKKGDIFSPKNQNRLASRPESISRREPTGFLGKGSSTFIVPMTKANLITRPLNRDWDTGGKVRKSASSPYKADTKISPDLSLWSTITSSGNLEKSDIVEARDNPSTSDFQTKSKGLNNSISIKGPNLWSNSSQPKGPGSPSMTSPSKKLFHPAKLNSESTENFIPLKPGPKGDSVSNIIGKNPIIRDTVKPPFLSKSSPNLPKRNEKNMNMKNSNFDRCNGESRMEEKDIIKPWESALAVSSAKYDKTYHDVISSYSKRYKILSQKETGLSPAVIDKLKKQKNNEDRIDKKYNEVTTIQNSLSPKRPITSKASISNKSPRSQPLMSKSVSSDISTSSSANLISNLMNGNTMNSDRLNEIESFEKSPDFADKNRYQSEQSNPHAMTPPPGLKVEGDFKPSGRNSSFSKKVRQEEEGLFLISDQKIEKNIRIINRDGGNDVSNVNVDFIGTVLFSETLQPVNFADTDTPIDALTTKNEINDEKYIILLKQSNSAKDDSNIDSDIPKTCNESETLIYDTAIQIS